MHIAYINHSRFPTEKAHGFQIAQVCDALTELEHEVTILIPDVPTPITASPEQYYGLRHPLRIEKLSCRHPMVSPLIPGMLRFLGEMLFYGRSLRTYFQTHTFDRLVVRSPYLLKPLITSGMPVIFELHAVPETMRGYYARLMNRCAKIVCLTTQMREEVIGMGVEESKVIVEADGVDLRRFENVSNAEAAKVRWKLPTDRPIIGYVGSLVTRETLEKGVRELIDAGARHALPVHLLWIVGGPQRWIDIYRKNTLSDDVRFQGRIETADVPSAIAACDVCVYPAPKTNHPYFLRDTSPLKLFEYLAAGRPVVCADLPPIRDVVDEQSVRFFTPGDAADLAAAIIDVLDHPEEARRRAEEGRRIAEEHSWEERMGRILRAL